MEDPRRCTVDVADADRPDRRQRAALKKIYAETTACDGAIYPAQPVGGEGETAGWPSWITGGSRRRRRRARACASRSARSSSSILVFNDPNWDYSALRHRERAEGRPQARRDVLNATNPDLERVQGEGRQADPVARLGGSGADGAGQHPLLRTGARRAMPPCATTSGCS